MKTEKLQKILAQAGLGSRRAMEQWVQAGRVSVDGKKAKLGDRAIATARIMVDGKPIRIQPTKTQMLLYNKPEGQVCTRADPQGRPTVFDHLPKLAQGKWLSIGRLDINTTGLLLFTNDGALAHRWMHPSANLEREYLVRVLGQVDKAMLKRLTAGVRLDDGMAKFTHMQRVGKKGSGANVWYRVTITEGRNREVRRLWESQQDIKVSRLKRIRFGDIVLPRDLRQGKWRILNQTN